MLGIKAHGKKVKREMRLLAWTQANIISAWMKKGQGIKADDLLGVHRPRTKAEIERYMADHIAGLEGDDDEEGEVY